MKPPMTINQVKVQNRKLVFREIAGGDKTVRLQIAHRTGLSAATVSAIIDEFLKKGIVREVKDSSSRIGRKPNILEFVPYSRRIVCIDLSTKNFRYEIKNLRFETEHAGTYRYLPAESYADNLRRFCDGIGEFLESRAEGGELLGIGVSVPGPYHQQDDKVINKLIPEIGEVRLHALLSERFPYPICIDHDVKLACKAEIQHIQGSGAKVVFFFYIGEGVGGALAIGDDIFGGAQEFAGEVGQMIIRDGKNVEQLVSWSRFLDAIGISPAGQEGGKLEAWLRGWHAGQADDGELDSLFDALGAALSNIVWMYNPHTIIIGGHYHRLGERFLEQLKERLQERLLPELFDHVNIAFSKYDARSALVGAASMVREQWIEHF